VRGVAFDLYAKLRRRTAPYHCVPLRSAPRRVALRQRGVFRPFLLVWCDLTPARMIDISHGSAGFAMQPARITHTLTIFQHHLLIYSFLMTKPGILRDPTGFSVTNRRELLEPKLQVVRCDLAIN